MPSSDNGQTSLDDVSTDSQPTHEPSQSTPEYLMNAECIADVPWKQVSVYGMSHMREEFHKYFFWDVQRDNGITNMKKRVLRQAAILVAMDKPKEVAMRAVELDDEWDFNCTGDNAETPDWVSLSMFLPESVEERFKNDFRWDVRSENRDLLKVNDRVLEQSAMDVAMEHPSEVAEKAREFIDSLAMEAPVNVSD